MRGRSFSYIIVIILVMILTIVVGYNYSVFDKITSIGTFLTAIITLLTLSEIRRQRIASFKPEIFIFDKKIKAVRNLQTGKSEFFSLRDKTKLELIYLRLINVGLGPAKKIQYDWKFNFDNNYKKVMEYDKQGHYKIDKSALFLDNDLFNEWPVVLQNEEYNVYLPISYTMILSRAIDIFLTQHELTVLPSIKLKVSFLDVYNNQSSKMYRITPKIYGGTTSKYFGTIEYAREIYFAVDEII